MFGCRLFVAEPGWGSRAVICASSAVPGSLPVGEDMMGGGKY